ncbi:MAG: hypothetical protein K0R93_691 [Anaerosolibacter sp.]|uniref:hypothetical protein n=1 Tax=Anaerosolibacter sp. TaxID=1872527 RepID=UPI002638FF56|nr:hypothetical protein [Anaerosolibacter sp.]MDF2545793.1 hypothetical protein [Anaerosolibacter sp.]
MNLDFLSTLTGLGLDVFNIVLSGYSIFKKSNVEIFFDKLNKSNQNLTTIGERPELQRYFFKIVDEVSREANIEKLESWKNVVIHLATDFLEFEYKDNFLRTLSDLTVFDLTVLHKIYSTTFDLESFESPLIEYFETKNINSGFVKQSLKRLASHNLIDENFFNAFTFSGLQDSPLTNLIYSKNDLGKKFLVFASDCSNL